MAKTVSIGTQDFEKLISRDCFYVDKTNFIREWWENEDDVTLITRPRRFGKTLNMSMLECFFSIQYQDRGEIFEHLNIWKEETYRNLQGTYPVIFLSFAGIKANNYPAVREQIFQVLENLYTAHSYIRKSDVLEENEQKYFRQIGKNMSDSDAAMSLHQLCHYLYRYYGKKAIILLDEYDTPLQEAYVNGYWYELVAFTRSLFNSTFKTNPYLERAIMTGIANLFGTKFATQTSDSSAKAELLFSDLNNLEVITTTSDKYANAFGFTETEVFAALDDYGMGDKKDDIKKWYDGFTFGKYTDIYNPWSIINYLDKRKLGTYWVNTSSNDLISMLIQQGSIDVKKTMEDLLQGGSLCTEIDEEIVFNQFNREILEEIVCTDQKQRYSFNEDQTLIRANQRHSISVDVELEVISPPDILWHGTGENILLPLKKLVCFPKVDCMCIFLTSGKLHVRWGSVMEERLFIKFPLEKCRKMVILFIVPRMEYG